MCRGSNLSKTVLFLFIAFIVSCTGCFYNPTAINPSSNYYSYFALVWGDYETNYPEFIIKNIDWKESFERYSPMAEEAETAEDVVMNVILPMLAELNDHHVNIYPPTGGRIEAWEYDFFMNVDIDLLISKYLEPNGFTGFSGNVGYCNPDSLPYLAINQWPNDLNIDAVRFFLDECENQPGIILDVRMNSGGSELPCDTIASFFTQSTMPGYRWSMRNGPEYDDLTNYLVRTIPDFSTYYRGVVYLLIGGYCASASELFIMRMSNLDNVVLVGDTTMGAVCIPSVVELGEGWQVTTIGWSARTKDNEPVEWNGIAPDLYIESTEEDFAQGIDPVLEFAIQLLNQSAH